MNTVDKYEAPPWRVGYLWRTSGLLEDICEHGVGHPNKDFMIKNNLDESFGVHGCCGCCSRSGGEYEAKQEAT